MYPLSIILFFLYCWSFGLVVRFAKEPEDFLERNLMRIGVGLGSMLAFGFLLNLLKIPLDWRVFLFVSILLVIIELFIDFKRNKFLFKNLKPFNLNLYSLIMLVLFFISFYMYASGAFAYPYLEDDDSWSHAVGIKFVSLEKTVFAGKGNPFHYIDPYPPAYDMLMGILHQTNNSVYWTLKFFNALIISLSIIFFYFFVKVFTDNSKKALFSTFALFAMPAFLSHFIWAIALTTPLFFVSFYAFEKIKEDNKWWVIASIVFMPTLTSSPSHSSYFAIFLAVLILGKTMIERKFLIYEHIATFFGFFLSFVLWWLPMIFIYKVSGVLEGIGIGQGTSVASIAGTGDRVYTINDFISLPKDAAGNPVNMINNPIGIGPILSLLFVISIIFLIYKYLAEYGKYKLTITTSFLIFMLLMLFFLFKTYKKFVDKRNVQSLAAGSVPFFEFLSDEKFVIITLLITVFLLCNLITAAYKNKDFKEKHLVITFLWLLIAFYAVNAGPFYFKLSPFRAWILLAVPVSILCGESLNLFSNLTKSISKGFFANKILASISVLLVIGAIFYAVFVTSFAHKYYVNTAAWFPGGFWTSNDEIQGYIWFKDNIPNGAKVFTFSNSALIIGLDKFICHWCSDVREYRSKGFKQSVEENYDWLKKGQYNYIIIDGQAARKFGSNETNSKVQGFINSNKFKPVFNNNGVVLFEVV